MSQVMDMKTIIVSGSKVMVKHSRSQQTCEKFGEQKCHNFGAQILLAENFVLQFFHLFGGPCMLTMSCYPTDATCTNLISFFSPNVGENILNNKNNDHTFHYLAQQLKTFKDNVFKL